jgi:endo-alpha-1,4-polygalactosaminidase (GH114 family)
MDVLYTTEKGRFMDTVEGFYIYKETRDNNQINDKKQSKNAIFDAINSLGSTGAHNK